VRHLEYQHTAAVLPMLEKAGVAIMAGTDAGFLNSFDYPALALHQELALYVKTGLTPAEALASATRAGPAWFGLLDRYGSVETGKQADLVLLNRNPLTDITATQSIDTVIVRGTVEDRAALDRLLAEAKAKVARWDAEAAK
jgi:imidazolonepropionase-like amidohydrolase